jgi:hypothetical protein
MPSLQSLYKPGRRRIALFATALLLMPALCLAKKYPMTPASIVPGAAAELQTGKDKNGNTEIKVKVQHLANPERLTPPKHTYVVWLQQTGGVPENAGTLRVNGKLEGSFQTTTPYTGLDVFITAEDDSGIKAPSGPEVLRAAVRP